MVINAPTAGAALNSPNPSEPTFKMSCAKMGSNATAPPKRTAIISKLKAPKMAFVLNTNRTPSFKLCTMGSPIFGFKIGFREMPNNNRKDNTTKPNTIHSDQ